MKSGVRAKAAEVEEGAKVAVRGVASRSRLFLHFTIKRFVGAINKGYFHGCRSPFTCPKYA